MVEPLYLAAFSAFVASGLLTFPVRRLVLRLGVVDRPNERSSHQVATPRAGGLAIVLGVALTVPWFAPLGVGVALAALCAGAVAAVSLADDVYSLPFWARLAVQSLAATAVVVELRLPVGSVDLPGTVLELPGWLGLAVGVLFVVAYCNFFNFMDGINGLAAGQATLSAATLAALLHRGGCETAAVVSAAVCGSSAGFLPHNYPSARIFMGDVGSVTLGFALAVLSLVACAFGGVPWTAVLLVNALFLYDPTATLVRRALRGENLVRPHREHDYQAMVRKGWPHRVVSPALWALSGCCCLAGYLYSGSDVGVRRASLLVTAALLAALTVVARRRGEPGRRPAVVLGRSGGR
jgi:UDP-N-acetylmuramyl pentapeptide phosphotransferase/UDP-N-acetylglucosamine-1-phosphate transferase